MKVFVTGVGGQLGYDVAIYCVAWTAVDAAAESFREGSEVAGDQGHF